MSKDLTYALAEGRKYGLALSTVASALEVVDQAVAAGNGEEDFSVLVEPLRRPAGETS
jgi:3-hydroxyisobutyrate dehydrogenase-like beta-hydroxyacid dehydrogenase